MTIDRLSHSKIQRGVGRMLLYVFALVSTLFIMLPIYIMIILAIQPSSVVFAGGRVNILISDLTLGNFIELIETTDTVQYFLNSLIVAGSSTVLSTAIAVTAGYGLTRFQFRGKSYFARGILFTYMFSPIVLAIPLYIIFFSLGLLNSYFGLVLGLTAISTPFAVWLMWQYFQSIPISLEESAWTRGASQLRALWDIVLPVARPGYISAAIFSFAVSWNDFTMVRVVIDDANKYTITVGASLFLGRTEIGWGETMAVAVLMCLPPFLIVLFLQNYLLQGFDIGGLE